MWPTSSKPAALRRFSRPRERTLRLGYLAARLSDTPSLHRAGLLQVRFGTIPAAAERTMEPGLQSGSELQRVLKDLKSVRDQARVRAHLLSMDTRRRLSDLETEVEGFEKKLAARGDWVTE